MTEAVEEGNSHLAEPLTFVTERPGHGSHDVLERSGGIACVECGDDLGKLARGP